MRRRARRLLSLALAAPLLLLSPSPAAPETDPRERELVQIRREIAGLEERLESTRRAQSGLAGELATTDVLLRLATERLAEALAARDLAAARAAAGERQVAALETALAAARIDLGRRLTGLYRLGRQGYLRLFLSLRPDARLLPSIRLMRYLARRDRATIDRYTEDRARLAAERDRLRAARAEGERWIREERARRAGLVALRDRQAGLLAQAERRRQVLAARQGELAAREKKLAGMVDLLYGRNRTAVAGQPMQTFRGLLDWPARGRVSAGFGPLLDPRYRTRVPHNGVDLETLPGSAVRAVFPGKVLFAAPFEGYGTTVVLFHSGRVLTLYAGLSEARVRREDVVPLAQVVGLASDKLYFEIRVENRPEDPAVWLRPNPGPNPGRSAMHRSYRSRILFLLVSAALVLPILAGTLLRAADGQAAAPKEDSFYKYLSVFSEVLGLVRQSYVDEPDMGALMSGALDGATDALDPFSLYVPAERVTAFEEAKNVGSSRSGLILLKEHGVAYVVAVEKGSPGAGAGLKVGDIVAKLDGRSTHLMPLWEVEQILARPAGTHVAVEVIRQGEPVKLAFDLKPFAPPPPALDEVRRPDGTAQVLRIPGFGPDTAQAVRAILSRGAERNRSRLLIDLRGVAAGDPEAAYAVSELFAKGDLGQLAGRTGTVKTFAGAAAPVWSGKAVVLVDRGTLGASEVLATVLHQKIGAELVGERTFGHAGRQGSLTLTSGRLLYTDAFYSGPDKKPLREALKPDLVVDERVRTFLEKDAPIDDLILDRGVRRLLGNEGETAKKAA